MKRKNKKDSWRCDFCHEEEDVLYFHGNEEICELCKQKIRGSYKVYQKSLLLMEENGREKIYLTVSKSLKEPISQKWYGKEKVQSL